MKHLLILGAGRSTTILIDYLLARCARETWTLTLGDLSQAAAADRLQGHPQANAIAFDVHDATQRQAEIERADLVISMLPASFHPLVAQSCLAAGKHLLTASYVPDEMRAMHADVQAKGLLFLMECGLDPGIDHMSAMRVIDQIRRDGHELVGFETFAGGLLHPDSCLSNPWEYKFTWNPRNVVLAGQGTIKFIQEGRYKYIPYHRLFRRTEVVHLPGHGYFEGYANRDSLKYLDVYQLQGIRTLFRGTFRRVGFCQAWNIFVQLGATDDSYEMEGVAAMTHRQFLNSFLSYDPVNSVELKLAHYLGLDLDAQEMFRLGWLGLFEEEPIGLERGTPAQVLEHILKKKWSMTPADRDQIVMWHKFDFLDQGQPRQIQSHLVVDGDDPTYTAMAKTVGLPLGIAAEQLLKGNIPATGVQIPILPSIYEPILSQLSALGLDFVEREIPVETTRARLNG
jgi:saccharopine dehydrogenase (NADP+, L-glutamate forming)